MPSYADGNGAVITDLDAQNSGSQLVITFDGPLDQSPSNPVQSPTNTANYSVQVPAANAQVVTSSTSAVTVAAASYNSVTFQVTLDLGSALTQGTFYRVFVNGTGVAQSQTTAGLVDDKNNAIDGDYDDTASGDFYALFAWTTAGTSLNFDDSTGDQVTLTLTGPGQLEAWRALDGDFVAADLASQANLPAGSIQQLSVTGGSLGSTVLSGSADFAGSDTIVVVPPIAGQGITFTNTLPSYFQLTPATPALPPSPIVATSSNLPYKLQIQQLVVTLPAVQSPVAATDNVSGSPYLGYWLLFGGRTNGLHNFNPVDPFPPEKQNFDIIVVNPKTWQTWTRAWSDTNIDPAFLPPLYSTNQQFVQQGDSLFAVGGYGAPETAPNTFGDYKTYDTLTALSVDGLIGAVVEGGEASARSKIQQIEDLRVQATGSEMQMMGGHVYLVVGQSFQGTYFSPTATQTYLDEIRSFDIAYDGDTPNSLAISNYQAQNDQVNLRRRDYNLAPIITPSLDPALQILGGVFTPGPFGGNGYRNPITINGIGDTQLSQYQQFFSQYSAPHIGLYDADSQTMNTILLGGISLYDYDFATGQLISDTGLPFVDDVTTLQQNSSGAFQEYMMPSQLPGLYGAEARFFQQASLPHYPNGVIQLDALSQTSMLGSMFGGIVSTMGNTTNQSTQTAASGAVFRVFLIPTEGSANTLFVSSLYQLLLNRAPDANAASWVDQLNAGASPASVILGIEASTEYLNLQVAAIYQRYLDRAPDPAGAAGWLSLLQNGGAFEQVAEGVVSSPEYYQLQGGTNEDFINGLYNEVLGRQPSPTELASWLTAMNSGTTRLQVAVGFLTSTEYYTDLVQSDYLLFLLRTADPAGLSSWVAALQSGATDQQVLAGILGSTEGFGDWS